MMRKPVSLLGIGLLVSACALGPGSAGSPTPWPRDQLARHYGVSTNPNEAIVRIDWWAGPPSPSEFAFMPSVALYGDGRVVWPGYDSTSIVQPLYQSSVTPEEIQLILAAADRAGLLGPDAHYDAPGIEIYDAGDTTFTITANGTTHTVSAYALGSGDTNVPSLTEARRKIGQFADQMAMLKTFLGREMPYEPYEPAALRVFLRLLDKYDAPDKVVAWPLSLDPAAAGERTKYTDYRCIVLSGPDIEKFVAAARGTTQATVWSFGDKSYKLEVRPLLPDETGCPST